MASKCQIEIPRVPLSIIDACCFVTPIARPSWVGWIFASFNC